MCCLTAASDALAFRSSRTFLLTLCVPPQLCDDAQTKAGSLSKKGSGDGVGSTTRWQSRFFVINQGVLMYFKSKSSVCPRRCLALAGATVREATAADTSQSHAFVIQAKVWRFHALES